MNSKQYSNLFIIINGIVMVLGFLVWSQMLIALIPLSFCSAIFLWTRKEYLPAFWLFLIGVVFLGFILSTWGRY